MNTQLKRTNGNMPAITFSGLVDRFFPNNASRMLDDNSWGFNGLYQNVNVPINIRETGTSYELELVAPGLKKEDLKVSIDRDILTISFDHHEEQSQQGAQGGWVRKEYQQRAFSRSFTVDEAVDANKIAAKYADGILHVTLPKKEGAQSPSRTIDIK